MNDREFLMWLYARLTNVHGESSLTDYMHKFRAVISSIPENQVTPNDGRGGNDLASLREKCAQQSAQEDRGCTHSPYQKEDGQWYCPQCDGF